MEDAEFDRVAYYDPAYQTGWVHDPEGVARLLAQRHGFIVLDAKRLAAWMKAVTSRDPSKTVCVLLQGLVPDTIAERKSKACTARRYLDAGGRLVSVGDVPFYQIGDARGGLKEWGNPGHEAVLGVEHIWGSDGETEVTEAGRQWGLLLPDRGIRCSKVGEVTALRAIRAQGGGGPLASTWHKVFHPQHPLQGFLRYRGGSLDARHWNAQVNELARLALRGFEDPFSAPDSWLDAVQARDSRVVFSDVKALVARLTSAHGFGPRDAEGLAAWMRAQIATGAAGSVAVILHGVIPKTVFGDASPQCLARRYLDAGGRLVWAGEGPFHNDSGKHEAVFDFPLREEGEMLLPSYLRDVGGGCRLKNYAAEVPGSGFLRFREGAFFPEVADELAVAALKDLPARAVAARPFVVEEEGERRGGGGFVVDRERALGKLMKFMLPSPELFLMPLARVAASSEATAFTVDEVGGDLLVRFSGRPLPAEAVQDPFAAVTAESFDPRLRAWGLAVLTALRARPRRIELESGADGKYSAAVVYGPDKVIGAEPRRRAGTTLRLVRPDADLPSLKELKAGLAARAPGFAELAERGARGRGAPTELIFDDGAVHGCLKVPPAHRTTSNLLVCVQGVGAARISFVLPGAAQVDGWVNDDRLGLNASLNGVVRDERLDRLRQAVAEKLPRLLKNAAARCEDLSAGRAERLARPGMAALWLRVLHGTAEGRLAAAWGVAARGIVPDALEDNLSDEAALVRWLRTSASGLLSSLEGDAGDPVRAALWKAPLFTASDARPLSLADLERFRRRDGRVLAAPALGEQASDARPLVWAPPGRETDALRRYFGDDVHAAGTRRAPAEGEGGPLEDAGLSDFLVRLPIDGGEVGLRLRPDRPGLRVHGLKDGRPDSFHLHAGRHRADAAVEGKADARAAAVAAGSLDRLYRLLSSSFSCPVSLGVLERVALMFKRGGAAGVAEREAAALSHLRDYLAASTASDGPAWPRSLPLFESSSGWVSHDDLAETLARDGVLLWAEPSAIGAVRGLNLEFVFGRGEGDARMPDLFKGLCRRPLDRLGATAWLKAPAGLSCSHGSRFGCLAEGLDRGAAVHLAVSEKGEVLLYPVLDGKVRTGTVEGAGRLAFDAALTVALRAPHCLAPGEHPWRAFVLEVAARELAPWPGGPEKGALRALLAADLTFQARWGASSLSGIEGALSKSHPTVYAPPGAKMEAAQYVFTGAELRFFRALWPDRADCLLTEEEWTRYAKALALETEHKPDSPARAMAAAKLRPSAAVVRGEPISDPEAGARKLLKDLSALSGSWAGAAKVEDFGTGRPRVEGSSLSASSKAAYLASLAHSSLNRARSMVTDANDAAFQAALAAWAVEEDA